MLYRAQSLQLLLNIKDVRRNALQPTHLSRRNPQTNAVETALCVYVTAMLFLQLPKDVMPAVLRLGFAAVVLFDSMALRQA
jgi:hypothetical protein